MTKDDFKRAGSKYLSKACGKKCSCCDWTGKKNHKPFYRRMVRSNMKMLDRVLILKAQDDCPIPTTH